MHWAQLVNWNLQNFRWGCAGVLLFVLVGCQSEKIEYLEVKRPHEELTHEEIRTYLKIVQSLPNKRVPDFPTAYAPIADWERSRTLSVRDLVLEEEKAIDSRWNESILVRQMMKNRPLLKKLRRARMTPKQFLGFTRTIGLALSRSTLRENQKLRKMLDEGNRAVAKLKEDTRSFVVLCQENEEDMHAVLQNAMWITRIDRIDNLLKVPPENVHIINKYKEKLHEVFPEDFTINPLDEVRDLLVEFGLPFEETELVGTDIDLSWSREEAIIGKATIKSSGRVDRRKSEQLSRIKELLETE